MADPSVIVSVARLATAALAALIAIVAARAYLATRKRSLLALAAGAALLAAGYLAEGVLVELAGWSIARATLLESVSTLAGAALLVTSLYMRETRPARGKAEGDRLSAALRLEPRRN